MGIEDHLQRVTRAEQEAEAARLHAGGAFGRLRAEAKAAATPWRIVTVGAVVGFMMGRSRSGADGTPSVGGRLFATVAQMLISALGASVSAGANAAASAGERADADAGESEHAGERVAEIQDEA